MQMTVKGMNIHVQHNEVDGYLTVVCDGPITITASEINFTGNLNVTGNIEATGTITDGQGNTNHHSH